MLKAKKRGEGHQHPAQKQVLKAVVQSDEPEVQLIVEIPESLDTEFRMLIASLRRQVPELKNIKLATRQALRMLIDQYKDDANAR